jgi:polysaccharide chain length determinant protein (PEP-CTERM system associated)
MQEKQELALLEHYFQLVLKKRWYLIIPFCLAVAGGFGWAIKAPRVYEAKTLILVEPQQVPGEFVKSIIPHDMGSRIATLSQQIMSRSNLEKIISQFKLFSGAESQKAYMEDKLDSLRTRIKVQVMRSENTGNAFSISFRDSDPELSMKVANALSNYFIEGNLQIREEQAEGTTTFLESELETMRVRLEEVEFELRDYRQRYMGELPEQMEANLRILETLQRQLEERKERLRDAKNRLMMVDKDVEQINLELEKERQMMASIYGEGSESVAKASPTIQRLYDELAAMQSNYTEMHPDVIRLRKKIEDMENLQQRKGRLGGGTTGISSEGERGSSVYSKPLREKMQQRLTEQLEIGKLQQDIAKIEREMRDYQQRIERTPKREGELIALKRDYDNIQNTYRSLLNRKLEANIAVNLEKKKKGEQFRILDYAKLPEKPVSPDTKNIFLKSLLTGLGIGAAILVLFQFLDPSIQRKETLAELGVPLLVTIPRIYNDRAKMWRRINNIASLFSVVVAGLLTAGFAIVALSGMML